MRLFNCLSPIIRKNITELFVYRLRNQKDLDSVLDELTALIDKKSLLEMYQLATNEPYSFWYINLVAKTKDDMFYIRLEKRMIPE